MSHQTDPPAEWEFTFCPNVARLQLTSAPIIGPFTGDQAAMDEIARLHVQIRRWQDAQGQTSFAAEDRIYDSWEDLTHIQESYGAGGGSFFVAHAADSGILLGFIGLKNDHGVGDIKRFAVHPAYHGQKIGSQLVDDLLAWARDRGFHFLKLQTGQNEHARPIYERAGFSLIGHAPNGDCLMELELP